MEELENEVNLDNEVASAGNVVKILFAIMNEEDSVDAYEDKSVEEVDEIIRLVLARFPEKTVASYDPTYTTFGQVCLNGYHTFGIDFLKALLKRTDVVPNLCIKGLIDIIENLMIENQNLALSNMSEEERLEIMKSISNEESLTNEEYKERLEKVEE